MYQELRTVNLDTVDVDQIVALLSFAKAFRAEYDANGIEVPVWVDDKIRGLKRELQVRHADQIEKRLREIKAQRDSLKTPAERRADLEAEMERLQKLQASTL